jgi:hypothetical protein
MAFTPSPFPVTGSAKYHSARGGYGVNPLQRYIDIDKPLITLFLRPSLDMTDVLSQYNF